MSDLCERLQDLTEAGVYCLSCPVEVLRGNAYLSELCFFEVDLANVRGKGEFLAAVAKAIHAPDWFGHNLDALADALGDLSWTRDNDKGYVLLLCNGGEALRLDAVDHAAVMQIFAATASYWKAQGKPFWIFMT
ncbi:MAG: barstar family protein [Sideroxyarcus sp.]|nr:barstar family protein [Sideroxyarcus sp.]